MDEAIDPLARGGLGERSGGVEAAGLKLVPPAPIADLGRAVKHPCDTGDGRLAGRRIRQIAAHDFDAECVQKIGAAARADQGADLSPWAISRSAR